MNINKVFVILLLIFSSCLPTFSFNIDARGPALQVFVKGPTELDANASSITPFFGYELLVENIDAETGNLIQLTASAPLEMDATYKSNTEEEDLISKEPSPQKRSLSSIPTTAMGRIYVCYILQSRFTNSSEYKMVNCTENETVDRHLVRADVNHRDGLGISLAAFPQLQVINPMAKKTQLVTCSPLLQQDCGGGYKAEGSCFVSFFEPGRSDNDYAVTWKRLNPCRTSCLQRDIDLMYVIDGSYSVGRENFEKIKKWIKDVTNGFDVTEQVQVGVVQYSYFNESWPINQWVRTEIELENHPSITKFDDDIDGIKYHGYKTYTAHAIIKTVRDDFNGPTNRYPMARRVMILLTDGKADDRSELPEATLYASQNDVESFAIGIGDYDESELELIAGGSDKVLTVKDFESLNEIVSRLQKDIQVLEERYAKGDDCTQSGGLYLGAVGAWDWSGTIVKYDNSTDETPDIPDFTQVQKVLVNSTKESYLGYALSSGFYKGGNTDEYVAIGAPRYKLEGAVVVYLPQPNNANFTNAFTIYSERYVQLGSYFGGALLSLDVNGDSIDDLIVAAPLYIGTNYDDGRVYVYLSERNDNGKSKNNPRRWADDSYQPTVLDGKSPGGRFGSAMASAGDLNNDGYNDIIIGAPYADDTQGAVYVYHGSASGVDQTAKQVIRASELPNKNLRYFGLSLQGGQDLDANGYPDVAVGAPKSDSVIIFRSRPVVRFVGSLVFSRSSIDVFQCFETPERNCLKLTACLNASGLQVEDSLPISYKIVLDSMVTGTQNKRVEFAENDQTSTGSYTKSGERDLKKNQQNCWTYNITVKQKILDYSTKIVAELTYKLTESHSNRTLSSIRDPSTSNKLSAETKFSRNCSGPNGECEYDLSVDSWIKLPASTLNKNGQRIDITENGTILVISRETENSPITVRVNFTNDGESAFDVRLSVTYDSQINWINLGNIQSSNPDFSQCVRDMGNDDSADGRRSKVLEYTHSVALGSIMQRGQWCYFEFNLSSSSLRSSGSLSNINVTVQAHTKDNGISDDVKKENNFWFRSVPVKYRADASVSQRSLETTIPFNFTNENETIYSVKNIGPNTADIQMRYEISGRGYSNIPASTISFTFPYTMIDNDQFHLLYLFSESCTSEGGAECSCDKAAVNPYNLLETYATPNDTNGPNATLYANPHINGQNVTYNCSDTENATATCLTLTCNVKNLGEDDIIDFRLFFRLWTSSLNLQNDTRVSFKSKFVYSTADSPLLINDMGQNVTIIASSTNTYAVLFTEPENISNPDNLWIYIVAAVGGLLLLVLIVIILWKTGFFKSKYAEKKEALEWQDAPDDSDMDMMKE